ncbi:MAG TPA: hypothetical protein VH934_10050 [Xanthobacteraceae bacterium]|jgi:hypothetical protein
MIEARTTARTVADGAASSLARGLVDFARDLARALFDPYRPELHYMRGPGPRWHAKHGRPPVPENKAPALALIAFGLRRASQ